MIEINNLYFSYEKKSPIILKDINLSIPKGIYLSVIGENGSCKTTLIKLILGLLKPSSGSIKIHTNRTSYVPQRLDGFNSQFPISVYEILKTHATTLGLDIKESINNSLSKVNMSDFKNCLIGSLSGGQQQRIFIGRSLMGDPDLIILDEPSTGVDFKNQREIYSLLGSLNKSGKTIISIEHNLEMALSYSTHILQIINGSVVMKTVNEYKKSLSCREA